MPRGRVLVVDDEGTSRTVLGERLRAAGYLVELAADGFKALAKADDFAPDLVLTDLRMPGMDGLELMRRLRARQSSIQVVMMTSFGGVETAVLAMKEGAADYLVKPLNLTQLLLVVARELERLELRRETERLHSRLDDRYALPNVIGRSPPMVALCQAAGQASLSRAHVLITGESGTGKELLANAIHHSGPFRDRPFTLVHGSALTEPSLEAALAASEGGALLIKEIAGTSPAVQARLARHLQEFRAESLEGGPSPAARARLLVTTSRDLEQEIAEGRFAAELYYGLKVVHLAVPALRDRAGDVPLLAAHFLERIADRHDKKIDSFAPEVLGLLTRHRWRGNVRELVNVVEHAVIFCTGTEVTSGDLPANLGAPSAAPTGIQVPGASLEQIERWAITTTLEACGGATGKAAKVLGISARKIQYKLQQYENAPKTAQPVLDEDDERAAQPSAPPPSD